MNNRPILAGIASIPDRVDELEQTVRSLAPQVDRVHVSLNDYEIAPDYLDEISNVTYAGRGPGNGGDAEKFAKIDEWDGVVLGCDDDLVYPPDYVATILEGLERHGPDAIVGFHGGKTLGYNGRPGAATHKSIRCLGSLERDDVDVNVLGTGALAFDTAHVPVWRGVFRTPNMADVYLACHAHRLGIRMVALAHEAGWLRYQLHGDEPTIYEANRMHDGSRMDTTEQRRLELGRVDWNREVGRPSVRVSIATCERPHLLADLLGDLEREAGYLDLDVAVYEDPSTADYADARARVARNGWSWHRFDERLGKERHWLLVHQELADCRTSDAGWFVFLPDDVRLVRHAIAKAIDTWDRLEDPATLTLWRLKDHEGQPNWTGRLPVELEHAFEVFHVDGIYLCRRETLEFLGYQCPLFSRRARRRRMRAVPSGRTTSSGVGRAMSLTMHRAGKRMYRVAQSLAVPVPYALAPSVMNPDVQDRVFPGVAL